VSFHYLKVRADREGRVRNPSVLADSPYCSFVRPNGAKSLFWRGLRLQSSMPRLPVVWAWGGRVV